MTAKQRALLGLILRHLKGLTRALEELMQQEDETS